MAFKFILCTILSHVAVAPVAVTNIINPSIDAAASIRQNVARSFAGTSSHHAKAVYTPYSSVRQTDTRINNQVYKPAVAKTVTTYATAPIPTVAAYALLISKTSVVPVTKLSPVVYSRPSSSVVLSHGAAARAAVFYSPAASVSHVAFDGFGTHWGY